MRSTHESIDLGPGETRILCAGLLAQRLYDQDHWSPDGWFVSKQERLRAAQLAGWAHELLKLIPAGKDRVPRSAILSVDGATFLHRRPEFRDRGWIEKQHQRHTRSRNAPVQLLAVRVTQAPAGTGGRWVSASWIAASGYS